MEHQALNRLQFSEDLKGGFSNKPAQGRLPEPLPAPLKLNLGCGQDIREGFINIDLFSENPSVVAMDIRRLELPEDCAETILASDILEHFSHRETDSILKEWARVLKPGGELIIRCPSLRLQAKAYTSGVWDADIASYMIFGGQTNPGDYHCTAFDKDSIKRHLENAGLEVDKFEEIDTPQNNGYINLNMTVVAKKPEKKAPETQKEFAFDFGNESFSDKQTEKEEIDSDFDFDFDNITEEDLQAINEETFSIDMLEEISGMDAKPEPERKEHEAALGKHLNIVWEGSQFVWHSLALINREHCTNILKTGLAELSIVPYEQETFSPEGSGKYMLLKQHDVRYKQSPPEEITNLPYIWIRHQWPPKAEPPQGAKWVIMQPWEYSCLPKTFAELFNQADEIWTPSDFSRKSMLRSGVDTDKVQVIPNGINPQLFSPKGKKYDLKTDKKLKYLFVGGTIFRKGIDILLESYLKAFTANDDVTLVIKDMGGDSFYKGQTAKEKIEEITQTENFPEIIYIDDYLDEEDTASLYRACDIFVSPYRGEGFSLPTLEAMACGLPVIVTEGGATEDFVDESFAWKIPAERISAGSQIDTLEMTEEAFLLEPDGEYLTAALQEIYIHASKIKPMGMKAMHTARTLWTWNRSTMMIFSRLDVLYGKSMSIEAEKFLKDEEDSFIILARAEIEYEKGNLDSAVELINLALASDDMTDLYRAHAHNRLASVFMEQKDYDTAIQSLETAKEILPKNPDSDYLLAIIHRQKDNRTEMLEKITEVFDRWKVNKYISTIGINLDDLLCDTAFAFFNDNDIEAALQLYGEALKINHTNARACFGSAKCFLKAEAEEEARTMLEWTLKLAPEHEEAKKELEKLPGKIE